MKNQIKSKIVLMLASIAFILIIAQTSKAQIGGGTYQIVNNLACAVTLDYKVFDATSPTCAVLLTGTGITIAANGGIYVVSTTLSGVNEDIEIVVNSLGWPAVNFGSPAGVGGGPHACYGPANQSHVVTPQVCGTFSSSSIVVNVSHAMIQ